MPSFGSHVKNTTDPCRSRNPILLLSRNCRSCRPSFGSRDVPAPLPTRHRIPSHEHARKTVELGLSVDTGREALLHMRQETGWESRAVLPSSFLAQRLGHPRRIWKPEFKEERCPPLDVPTCCASCSWVVVPVRRIANLKAFVTNQVPAAGSIRIRQILVFGKPARSPHTDITVSI